MSRTTAAHPSTAATPTAGRPVASRRAVAVLGLATPLMLAHDAAGATWQALLVVLALGLVAVVVLAVAGTLRIERPDDLILPLAGVAIVSSLAPLGSAVLSDWVGWAFPAGVVMLLALVLAVTTPLTLEVRSPLPYGAAVVAVAGAALLHGPLTVAWHPPPDLLPLAEDVEIEVTAPQDGATLPAGTTTFEVTIHDGSVAEGFVDTTEVGPDPEEGGVLIVAVDGATVEVSYDQDCTRRAACTEVSFPIDLDPGDHRVTVEFRRADGASFTPLVTDRVELTVE